MVNILLLTLPTTIAIAVAIHADPFLRRYLRGLHLANGQNGKQATGVVRVGSRSCPSWTRHGLRLGHHAIEATEQETERIRVLNLLHHITRLVHGRYERVNLPYQEILVVVHNVIDGGTTEADACRQETVRLGLTLQNVLVRVTGRMSPVERLIDNVSRQYHVDRWLVVRTTTHLTALVTTGRVLLVLKERSPPQLLAQLAGPDGTGSQALLDRVHTVEYLDETRLEIGSFLLVDTHITLPVGIQGRVGKVLTNGHEGTLDAECRRGTQQERCLVDRGYLGR